MKKVYLALSFLGTFLLGVATAHAIAMTRVYNYTTRINTNNATLLSIWSSVDTLACTQAEADLGLSAGACTIEPGATLFITKSATATQDEIHVALPMAGNWTKN